MLRDPKQYVAIAVTAESNVLVDPPAVITGAANVVKLALADELGKREISLRVLQNTGASDIYYSVGFDKPNVAQKVYHGKIPAGGQFDFSKTDKAVYITSDGAYEAAPCVISRNCGQ